jgi:hypothetical protein
VPVRLPATGTTRGGRVPRPRLRSRAERARHADRNPSSRRHCDPRDGLLADDPDRSVTQRVVRRPGHRSIASRCSHGPSLRMRTRQSTKPTTIVVAPVNHNPTPRYTTPVTRHRAPSSVTSTDKTQRIAPVPTQTSARVQASITAIVFPRIGALVVALTIQPSHPAPAATARSG